MFHILDFIDSKDIRDYNKDANFTPLEQAVIIYYSLFTSVEEKLSALKELLEQYNDEDFLQTKLGRRDYGGNRDIIVRYVKCCEDALNNRLNRSGVVFVSHFWEPGFEDRPDVCVCSSYEKALNDIKKRKMEYDLDNWDFRASIIRKPLNSDDSDLCDKFLFDRNLMMYSVIPGKGSWEMERFFVYIPTPFKCGDIVKRIGHLPSNYGVVSTEWNEAYYRNILALIPDASDMTVTVETYVYRDGNYRFDYSEHLLPLYLEKCQDKELPKEQIMLTWLRDAYIDASGIRFLLEMYTTILNKNHDKDFVLDDRYESIQSN